jgi:nonribosomal peptide synthetase DhbF
MINMEKISGVSPAMKHIFLIEGSGFVGGHLLASLLHTDARLICLMRGNSIPEATQRLAASLEKRQLTIDLSRVDVLLGDLSKPRLGLQDSHYAELQQSVDLIIHSGADVSLYSKYDKLKAVNVDGLGRVLEFATGNRRRAIRSLPSKAGCCQAQKRP